MCAGCRVPEGVLEFPGVRGCGGVLWCFKGVSGSVSHSSSLNFHELLFKGTEIFQ